MSTNFKKIKYHLCAFFVLSLSLLLLLTRYNYVFERSAQAFKLLFDSFVEWCNVFVLAAKQPGSELNIDTSISNFNFVNYLEINVDNLYFAFENLGNTLFDSNNFSFYSFWFFYFVIISILVFALSYAVLNFIGTVYEMVVYDFSENPYEDTKALAFFKKTFVKTYSSVKIKFLKFCTWFFDSKYKILFLITWFLNFNLLAIVVEFFGWFFYCMSCGNFWTCISTLLLDLALGFSSLPLLFWLILAVFVFHKVRKSRGDSNLFHLFNYCIGFLKSLGNNVLLEGPTGASKSKILVQMSRMKEVQFHTDQFDSINKFHIWFSF